MTTPTVTSLDRLVDKLAVSFNIMVIHFAENVMRVYVYVLFVWL